MCSINPRATAGPSASSTIGHGLLASEDDRWGRRGGRRGDHDVRRAGRIGRLCTRRPARRDPSRRYPNLCRDLSRCILPGLEVLITADIVRTINRRPDARRRCSPRHHRRAVNAPQLLAGGRPRSSHRTREHEPRLRSRIQKLRSPLPRWPEAPAPPHRSWAPRSCSFVVCRGRFSVIVGAACLRPTGHWVLVRRRADSRPVVVRLPGSYVVRWPVVRWPYWPPLRPLSGRCRPAGTSSTGRRSDPHVVFQLIWSVIDFGSTIPSRDFNREPEILMHGRRVRSQMRAR